MGRPRSGPRAHSFVSRSRIALTPHPLLAGDVGRPGLQIVAFDGRAKRIGRAERALRRPVHCCCIVTVVSASTSLLSAIVMSAVDVPLMRLSISNRSVCSISSMSVRGPLNVRSTAALISASVNTNRAKARTCSGLPSLPSCHSGSGCPSSRA